MRHHQRQDLGRDSAAEAVLSIKLRPMRFKNPQSLTKKSKIFQTSSKMHPDLFKTLVLAVAIACTQISNVSAGSKSPQQCANYYGAGEDSNHIHCFDHNDVHYSCLKASCHTGGPNTPVSSTTSIDKNFFFENCAKGGPHSKDVYPKVYPKEFTANNAARSLVVNDGSAYNKHQVLISGLANLTCAWNDPNERNAQRPYCNDCQGV
ncbi:hypothetical protein O181_115123 [Austropuccinia psidii MF-1]|uniref:Uncharacterized protein n=1 Tax=Austropuccinia psidii MF-1 TaxID=1389203 RepID=A0A9Q3K5T2_9BASI|nr:hypothetical protein [Austropuccinia psidii MF-1]